MEQNMVLPQCDKTVVLPDIVEQQYCPKGVLPPPELEYKSNELPIRELIIIWTLGKNS